MTYYLQTWDNTTHEIDEHQHEAIMEQSTSGEAKGLWLGKSYIAFSSIKSIEPKEERDTGMSWDEIKQLGSGMEGIINRASVDGKKAITQGLERVIARKQLLGESTAKAQALLVQMQQGKLGRIVHEFYPDRETWAEYQDRISILNAELA